MKIRLTQNKYAIIDKQNFQWLKFWTWHFVNGYAIATIGKKEIPMHHLIYLCKPSKGYEIDHINGDGLDNQRKNLRIATRTQNQQNRKPNKNSTSKYKGVYFDKSRKGFKKWVASIKVNKKLIHLGRYLKEIDAALAYNHVAVKHFGRYARINSI